MLGDWRLDCSTSSLGIVAVLGSAAVVGRAIIGVITGRWRSAAVAGRLGEVALVVAVSTFLWLSF